LTPLWKSHKTIVDTCKHWFNVPLHLKEIRIMPHEPSNAQIDARTAARARASAAARDVYYAAYAADYAAALAVSYAALDAADAEPKTGDT
jgi:hypothetical protein